LRAGKTSYRQSYGAQSQLQSTLSEIGHFKLRSR
jgi:hypothetical protein